jgi:hypothetical protein
LLILQQKIFPPGLLSQTPRGPQEKLCRPQSTRQAGPEEDDETFLPDLSGNFPPVEEAQVALGSSPRFSRKDPTFPLQRLQQEVLFQRILLETSPEPLGSSRREQCKPLFVRQQLRSGPPAEVDNDDF